MTVDAAFILAGGVARRWDAPYPKQLCVVDGEPVLHRTARLLHEAGVEDVYIFTKDARLFVPDTSPWWSIKHRWLAESVHSACSAFGGDLAFFMGDCWFSPETIDRVLAPRTWRTYFVGRSTRSGVCCGGENYGWRVSCDTEAGQRFMDSCRRAADLAVKAGAPPFAGDYGTWKMYRGLVGVPLEQHILGERFIDTPADDWTQDFDKVEQYEAWIKAWRVKR